MEEQLGERWFERWARELAALPSAFASSPWWERKFFRVAIYMAFGLFSFCLFFVWTFPDHRVKEIAANWIEVATDHRYEVSIEGIGFWRLTGAEVEGVQLSERVAPGEYEPVGDSDEDSDSARPERAGRTTSARLERISVRLSPIRSLLNRGLAARYQIDVGGSVIDGTFVHTGAEQRLDLSLNDVDLRQSTLLASLIGLPLFGVLDGDVELVFDSAAGQIIDGRVDITGEKLTLGSTVIESDQIPVFTELELPTTSFGNLELKLNVEDTEQGARINFERFRTRGLDLNTEVWGHIDIGPRGGQPRLEMRLQVKEEYVTEHGLGLLFNMSEFRDGEYRDWYGFVLAGTFDNINFQGSTTAAQGPDAGGDSEDEDDSE